MDDLLKILILVLYVPFVINGQSTDRTPSRLKYLAEKDTFRMGECYLQCTVDDSMNRIVLYLVNKSEDTVSFYGISPELSVSQEAKDMDGDWKKVFPKREGWVCGTGLDGGPFYVPPNAYTWAIFDKKMIEEGSFETELRFWMSVNEHVIYSKPIPAHIKPYRFLPWQYQLGANSLIEKDTLLERDKKNILAQAQVLMRYTNDVDDGIKLVKQLLVKAPDFYKAHLVLGRAYLRRLSGLSGRDQYVLLSYGLMELKKVPKVSGAYGDAKKILDRYFEFLPTHAEWEKVDKSDCKEIDGQYQCLEYGSGKWVEILFKD